MSRAKRFLLKGLMLALGLALASSLAAPASAQRGRRAPDFHVLDINGREIWLSKQLRGCGVVLYFFHSRCETCARLLPKLVEAHREFRDKGVVFIGIASFDDGVREFVARHGVPFSVVTEHAHAIEEAYKVTVEVPQNSPTYQMWVQDGSIEPGSKIWIHFPSSVVLISRNGIIQLGPEEWSLGSDGSLRRRRIDPRTAEIRPVAGPPTDVMSAVRAIVADKTCKVGRDVLP
ncbi:MAG: TlpA family protein disulfide reductase [Thermoflexales bacterium]|nr:TlpA family protein disulfide reductase [Thermoflexales bacterium]